MSFTITRHMGYIKSTYRSSLPVNDFLKGLLFEMEQIKPCDMKMNFEQIYTLTANAKGNQIEIWCLADFKVQRPVSMTLEDALSNICYEATHKRQPMPVTSEKFLDIITV